MIAAMNCCLLPSMAGHDPAQASTTAVYNALHLGQHGKKGKVLGLQPVDLDGVYHISSGPPTV